VPSASINYSLRNDGVLIAFLDESGEHLPLSRWATAADPAQLPAIALAQSLLESEQATESDEGLLISHARVAALSDREAAYLGLPGPATFLLELRNEGSLDQPDFRLTYRWLRPNGQPVVVSDRLGTFLHVGTHFNRLPAALFELIEGIDQFNATPITDADGRYRWWAELRSLLPPDLPDEIRASGYLRDVRIAYASAFSLNVSGTPADIDFDPVLYAARPRTSVGAEAAEQLSSNADLSDDSALLPPDYQEIFAKKRFRAFRGSRSRYPVADGWYVVLSGSMQKALDVVRRMQTEEPSLRREFVRNPRIYLRDALANDLDETLIENLFLETTEYSTRVRDIGLWQPKVLPWVVVPREPWLPPETFGIQIAGERVELKRDEVAPLIDRVKSAIATGQPHVSFGDHQVPATPEAVAALGEIAQRIESKPPEAGEGEKPASTTTDAAPPEARGKTVLLIQDNLDTLAFEANFERRIPDVPQSTPLSVATSLKAHQSEGTVWLQQSWQAGRPGVLLADDMGLGKTLQALTFLAWIRDAMSRNLIRRAPILIVAPTGLLANWEAEHDRHLLSPGLGRRLRAHGAGLTTIRLGKGSEVATATPALDQQKLIEADWVLTTYETLRDYQHSFGRIPFGAAVFDEVQKIKTPGTMVTEAAKAMKADFAIAMTGTPIENRLADLWCITDTVQPGLLGDLKAFSKTYEQEPSPERLRALKNALSSASPTMPPLMLRRLKEDRLPGLPEKHEIILERPMPSLQAESYRKAVDAARADRSRSSMLRALQQLRMISLHPLAAEGIPDNQYIAASARYAAAFEILDRIHAAGERVLIFLEFLEPQAFLSTLIQRRYRLAEPPMLINGTVSGPSRQQRVDRFQAGPGGFDAIILSPRAGGVGITLTAANHVIHLSRWWNPAVEDQCTDRAYRIGQARPVTVYCPMALLPGDEDHSFDRRLHKLLRDKRTLSRDMLIPPAATDEEAARLFEETVGVQTNPGRGRNAAH